MYHRHFLTLVKTGYAKTSDLSVAEELAQDTFMVLYRHRDNVQDNPIAYLRTVLRHKIIAYYEQHSKRLEDSLTGMEFPTEGYNPVTDYLDMKDMKGRIAQAVASLPDQCRRVFLLSREEQLSNREIAEQLGISVKTVEQHMTKALRILRDKLDYHLFVLVMLGMGLW